MAPAAHPLPKAQRQATWHQYVTLEVGEEGGTDEAWLAGWLAGPG